MQSTFRLKDLAIMEQRYRAHFVNSLSGFKSANLIGTVDAQGNENLSIVSSCVHLGADPALIGFVSRPNTVERHTIENIKATGEYTLNHVHAGMINAAHQSSARYARHTSEFTETGLTPLYGEGIAPFVAQSKIRLYMSLRECLTIELNSTEFIIGEIQQVTLPSSIIAEDGKLLIENAQSVAVSGLDEYHTTQTTGRLAYAKPNQGIP